MLRRICQAQSRTTRKLVLPFAITSFLLSSLFLTALLTTANAANFAEPALQALWEYADRPVTEGLTPRSWTWGPVYSEGKNEPYVEAGGGTRLVQYFDKARMEITNPNVARDSQYFVTNGLLVTELISGQVQIGDNKFLSNPAGPALTPVAGDPTSTVSLTYASFAPVSSIGGGNRNPNLSGQSVIATLSKDSLVNQNSGAAGYGVTNTFYENTLGHNIPNVFINFLNQQGLIYQNNRYTTGLVLDWPSAAGLPLSEAYWSRAVVGGVEKDVLVQVFQRRVLTYTPSNPMAYRVEMGNVGQHYYNWRYNNGVGLPGTPTPAPATPTPAPNPTSNPLPAAPANWTSPAGAQAVARPVIRVRPTDGQVWIVGENKGVSGILASSSGSNFGNVLNLKPGSGGEKVQADFDSSGNLHVFWQESGDGGGLQTFYARINNNGSQAWLRNMGKELANNNSTGLPGVFFNSATRRLYLVQEENPQTVVFYESADEGQTWINRQVLASGNATQTNPKVVGDASGNIHVAWNRNPGSGNEIFTADRLNNNWTGPVNVTQYNGSWSVPSASMGIASNGDAYMTFISPGPNTAAIGFARYSLASRSWTGKRDNISNTSSGFGSFKSASLTVTSNGVIWIAFCLDNGQVADRSGAYYLVSSDGGNNWSEVRNIFRKSDANSGDLYSYGGNLYFAGLFSRQVFYSYRNQNGG